MLSLYTFLALPVVAVVLASALISLALCLHDLLRRRHSLPSLHFRESALNSRLLARCGLRHRVFSPAFWLTSPHVQTVLAACWPRGGDGLEVSFQREYLQMRDKGVVALDWVVSLQSRVKRKSTVLLVLPPVTGDARTCSALCELATRRGFRTVVFNRRGHGGSVLTTARLLSAADPSDLRQVIKYLRLRFPKSRLAAVAYGTGCGLLISYLGEFGSSAFLSAGACVSPCYDTVEKFSGSLRSVYDLVHLLKLKWILLQHASALSGVVDIKHALFKAWSFRAYEEAVYCRMYNHASRSDSTSRGLQSAGAVNANGVVASFSGAAVTTSAQTSVGGSHCATLSSSAGFPHSPGAPNGNVVVDAPKAAAPAASSALRSASSSSLMSEKASRFSSSGPPSVMSDPPLSDSLSLSTPASSSSSSSSRPVSESVASSATRNTRQVWTTSSESIPRSESDSSVIMSKLPPASAAQPAFSSSATSKESLVSQSKSNPPSQTSSGLLTSSSGPKSTTSSLQPPILTAPHVASASTSLMLPSPSASLSPPPSPSSPPPPSPSSGSYSLGALEEYWERNNPIRDVDDIAVPVLCINSLDDPFCVSTSGSSASTIPYDLFRCYPNFLLVVTEKGGHSGFLERHPFTSWADSLCLDYLEAVFELTTKGYSTTTSSSTSSASTSTSRRNTRSTI